MSRKPSPLTSVANGYDIPIIDEAFYIDDEDDLSMFECELCHDTGFVLTDEDDGEGHTRSGIGTRQCLCALDRQDWEDGND